MAGLFCLYKAEVVEKQHNTELNNGFYDAATQRDILKTGHYGHLYSASIHVSTMVPRNTVETMDRVLQSEEQRKQLSDYMRSWLKK